MIKKGIIKSIVLTCLSVLWLSQATIAQDIVTDPAVLGTKLQNPYSVQNMQRAWNNIKPKLVSSGKITGDEVEIVATHYYVRFMPSDSLELDVLLEDPALELYTFPLDYDVQVVGEFYYHDPEIPLGVPTYQYTVVLADYKFPDIQYEILSELYLPDEEGHTETGRIISPIDDCLQTQLVNESMSLTGNYDEIVAVDCEVGSNSVEQAAASSCDKCPQGQILVENPISGAIERDGVKYDGVPEVKARARKWFKIKTAETNENGEFIINHVFGGNRKVNYGIKYTNNHAFIKPVTIGFGPAFLNGPKTSGKWEYRSHRGSHSYLWGAIMRGVYDYHHIYTSLFDIGAPPNDVKIKACAERDCGVTTMLHKSLTFTGTFSRWLFSDIKIGGDEGLDTNYNLLYNTTIHELGHAAHWKLAGDWLATRTWKMAFSHKLVRESWACGIADTTHALKFDMHYYSACKDLDKMLEDGYGRVLVRDLMDNVNEFVPGSDDCDLNDNVSGLSLNEIFYALEDVNSNVINLQFFYDIFGEDAPIDVNHVALLKWMENLIKKHPSQKETLKEYFAQWLELEYIPCDNPSLIKNTDLTNLVNVYIEHTNEIILKDGFRFKALNSNYTFETNIFCPVQQENPGVIAGKVDEQFQNETRKDLKEEFIYIGKPNISKITHLLHYEATSKTPRASVNEKPLVFYPNPATKELFVREEGSFVVIIYDSKGNVILKSLKNEGLARIGLESLAPSMYILKVVSGNSVKSEFFIKK